jgi:hypothetical protein
MKILILASAAVQTLGFRSAFAATTDTRQQTQQQVAISAQTSAPQTGTFYDKSSDAPAPTVHIGGWQPVPPGSMSGGD